MVEIERAIDLIERSIKLSKYILDRPCIFNNCKNFYKCTNELFYYNFNGNYFRCITCTPKNYHIINCISDAEYGFDYSNSTDFKNMSIWEPIIKDYFLMNEDTYFMESLLKSETEIFNNALYSYHSARRSTMDDVFNFFCIFDAIPFIENEIKSIDPNY